MTRAILTILTSLIFISACYSQDSLRGEFEYNKILNECVDLNDNIQKTFKKRLKEFNYDIIDKYLRLLENNQDEKANSVLSKDKKLKNMPTRAIALIYSLNQVDKFGLLDYPCISLKADELDGGKTIYLTKLQLEKIKPFLDKSLTLKVRYVGEAKLTKFKIYKLLDK